MVFWHHPLVMGWVEKQKETRKKNSLKSSEQSWKLIHSKHKVVPINILSVLSMCVNLNVFLIHIIPIFYPSSPPFHDNHPYHHHNYHDHHHLHQDYHHHHQDYHHHHHGASFLRKSIRIKQCCLLWALHGRLIYSYYTISLTTNTIVIIIMITVIKIISIISFSSHEVKQDFIIEIKQHSSKSLLT